MCLPPNLDRFFVDLENVLDDTLRDDCDMGIVVTEANTHVSRRIVGNHME